jgi:hypothetical protein
MQVGKVLHIIPAIGPQVHCASDVQIYSEQKVAYA